MKLKKISIFVILCMTILLCGCNSKKTTNLIKTPDKIIIYKDGKEYAIDKNDKDFNKIVELTNKRIDISNLAICKDIINDDYVNQYKKKLLAIEFLYNQEQNFDINTEQFNPIKYYKLFFILIDKDPDSASRSFACSFQYGNINSYIDSSRGILKSPDDLIKLINSMDLK